MRLRHRRGRGAVTRLFGLCAAGAIVVLGVGSTVSAQTEPRPDRGPRDRSSGPVQQPNRDRTLPAHIAGLKLDTPESTTAATADFLRAGIGSQRGTYSVRLTNPSAIEAVAADRNATTARAAARSQQAAFMTRVRGIDSGARAVSSVSRVLNAVFLKIDASKLAQVAADPAVERIAPVGNYKLDLSETVPYIGARQVQNQRITGRGIRVAVLDSGIDYTHAALGGSGNPADFAANDPEIIEPGTFPTAKVKGGFDFVGPDWDGSDGGPPEAPDPDPLDAGTERGHGTHVGHIIGGKGGVAPGVDLYAVKVCSSVATSCSGIALIQGMDWALDPNGDDNMADRVHIINMSLGSDYGQPFDDDLSEAVEDASAAGTLVVASAGNGGDKPFIAGTPASADSALSVAQTAVPSSVLGLMQIITPAGGNRPAVFQPWSKPLTAAIQAPVRYGNGAGGNLNGCASFPAGSLAGTIVLVDRGACDFSLKISNIADGGGLIGIIGLIAPGDPFEGGLGAGDASRIPGYMISLANANAIRGAGTVVRFDPAVGIALKGSMVGSSSRGPQHESTQRVKPEIGAPGASVSAVAGSGTGTEPFGGTSGAAPMVTGSAALVIEAFGGVNSPTRNRARGRTISNALMPIETKALLMNNAEKNIISNPVLGSLAEITRIGGGEVRVNQSAAAPVAAWDDDTPTSALGWGFMDVTDDDVTTSTKTVRVRNFTNTARTYTITPTFRFANDQATGAVTVNAPANVLVPGNGQATFDVTLTIDASKLPANAMNSGADGANPAGLTLNEYDGYLNLTSSGDSLSMPWHVLPRKAAEVTPSSATIDPPAFPGIQLIGLNNQGFGTAQVDAYTLLATSPDIPAGPAGGQSPTPDLAAVGINTFPVDAGVCLDDPSFIWAFSINSHERQQHLMPVSYWVWLDTNMDGEADWAVLNRDVTLNNLTDGRQLAWTVDLGTGEADAFFFAEHSTNTGNTVLYICAEQIGMTEADMLATNVGIAWEATDFYYGGPGDVIGDPLDLGDFVVTPLGEGYFGVPTDVPANTNDAAALDVTDFGPFPGNTPELGLMLVTNGDRGAGARGGATEATELIQLPVAP